MLYYLSARAPPTDESGEKKFDPLSSPPRPSFPSGVMNCGGELSNLSSVEFDHSQQSVRFSSSPKRHQFRLILLPPHASLMLCFSSFHVAQKYESLFSSCQRARSHHGLCFRARRRKKGGEGSAFLLFPLSPPSSSSSSRVGEIMIDAGLNPASFRPVYGMQETEEEK